MKKQVLLFLFALLPMAGRAYDVEVDGIYYNIFGDVAEVTYLDLGNNRNTYSGTITIPSSITYYDTFAYMNVECRVTRIGESAFYECENLTSVNIPNSVLNIGNAAFKDCIRLTSVNIPEGIISIGEDVFNHCPSLTSISIPNGVTSIGGSAFQDCRSLTSIIIPNTVTNIDQYAFCGCTGLSSVTIPKSVASIGSGCFTGCNLSSLAVEEGNVVYDSRDNCNAIIKTSTDELVAGCKNTLIPNSIISLGIGAFYRCENLTSITIPNSVTSIGNSTFFGCSNLTSITIPNSVTSIGSSAFDGCSNLTSITIPNSVTSIGLNAFRDCSNLTSITIPNSVTSIGLNAFRDCSNLTSITIPNSVTSIGLNAFRDCSNLTSITIPNSVTSIGSSAFDGCSNLTSITIPNSVTSIGSRAFDDCDALISVTIKRENPIAITEFVFTNRANATLYVPFGNMANYESADYWKEFKKIAQIPLDEFHLIDGEEYSNSGDVSVGELNYSRTYKNTNWQAWYVPFDMTVTDDLLARFSFGKFAGTYTAGDEFFLTVAYLKLGDVMKANTPYFIKAKVADSSNPQVITLENSELRTAEETGFIMLSAEKKVTIQGIYSEKVATEEDHDWYAYGGGLYRHPTVGQKLSPYRFFLTIKDRDDNPYSTTPAPAEVKILVLDDMETSIELQSGDIYRESEGIYDLSGRRLNGNKLNKGIYIINGKKVLVK